ncbi:aminopeptidase N [Saxibacter everestensis]|uniref:Aminopeptidase N n=1 Tax=Saxibacter everestensis TaxID=2909229 RepID=A0ABY8QU71_9MICO|nr:aminopeptidase N [Brevibacteriaceae bacterium ZFBP1038]
MSNSNLSRAEAAERSRILDIDSYHVALDLSEGRDPEETGYDSVTTIRFHATEAATTFIDLIAAEVRVVELNGKRLDPDAVFDGARITIPGIVQGENSLWVHARANYSRTGEGLHRFVDPADGETYLYTQFEPTDARRVFANFDQPDLKARFSFTIVAPDDWLVLSNSAAPEPQRVTNATAAWEFPATERLSSYITCIAAGPWTRFTDTWTSTTSDGQQLSIELGATVRASLAKYLDADEIFEVTKAGMQFFHGAFDYPYPWGKYDQLFAPEYNLGGMENPGLVTFAESFVFHSTATEADRERRANVIMHEMAHMWFGDLVTMQWWDDLWLKESFADYMGSLAVAEATRWKNSWVTFANRRKAWAYKQDQLPTTHPIVADIPDVEAAKLNFDGITYAKGAAVLKQLVSFVGREAFFSGARQYFRDHAFGNTTLVDFLKAMEHGAGDRDVREWADSWLQTAGTSTLIPEISTDDAGVITSFVIRQEAVDPTTGEDAPRPHRIAIGFYELVRNELRRTHRSEVDIAGPYTEIPDLSDRKRPALVIVNDDDLTFAKVRLDDQSLGTVRRHLFRLTATMPRALIWSILWNATRDAVLPAGDFLELADRHLVHETDPSLLATVQDQVIQAIDHFVPREFHLDAVDNTLCSALDALSTAQPGSDRQLDTMLFVIRLTGRVPSGAGYGATGATSGSAETPAITASRTLLQALLRLPIDADAGAGRETTALAGLKVDTELRWAALTALTATGYADLDDIAAERAEDSTSSGEQHAVRARASRPLPIVRSRAWSAAVEHDTLSNDLLSATISGFVHPAGWHLIQDYVGRYFDMLEPVWSSRSIEISRRLVAGLFPHWAADKARAAHRAQSWLDGHQEAPAGLRRLIIEGRDELERAQRAAQ